MSSSKKLLPINEFCQDSNGNNINSRIILQNFKNEDNSAQYLHSSREIKFLKKGRYRIKLSIFLSNENESDSIAIKLGSELIRKYKIPIEQDVEFFKDLTLTINDTNNNLSIINNSDDKLVLKIKEGGYIMDNPVLTVNAIDQPIQLTATDANNKTVTIVLNSAFQETDDINIYKTDGMQSINNFKVVEDSISPTTNKRVIVNDTRFESNTSYTVTLTRGTQTAKAEFTVPQIQTPPINADIDVFGDRILNLKFEVPIQYLDAQCTSCDSLNNFYILYYNNDSTGNLVQDGTEIVPTWFGMLNIGDNSDPATVAVTPRKSDDLKSLEIQFNTHGIPVGSHKFIINFSKSQVSNPELMLKDFSDDANIVPTMEKEITVVKDAEAAKPISVTAVDRTTLIVTFDKPVLLTPSEINCITVPGVTVTVSNATRVGNDFKTLKYEISDSTPLPIGNIDVTIGRITDANGYKTFETTFNDVTVTAVKPTILEVTQYQDSQSKVLVKFSKSMKTTGTASVLEPTNYTISKLDGTFVNPQTVTDYNATEYTVVLTTAEELEAGSHTLHAENIEDYFGLAMDPQDIEFSMIDVSEPVVESITYRNQAIVIKFDERMATTGEHSVTEMDNYMLEDSVSSEMMPLSNGTSILTMENDKWVRITTIDGTTINTGLKLDIGYKALKYIKFVTNASGNILDICTDRLIGSEIEAIDITGTSSSNNLSIIGNDTLQYKYPGDNEFYSVNKNDFTIEVNGTEIVPLSVSIVDTKTLEFVFEPNTFDAGTSNITFKTNSEIISTTDIFGYKIEADATYAGTVNNNIPAEIVGISLVDTNKLRMIFNKNISIFGVTDFGCRETVAHIPANISIVSYAKYDSNDSVWDLTLASNVGTNTELVVYQAVSNDLIQTTDSNNNKLSPFAPISVSRFFSNTIEWKHPINSTTLANNKLVINFTSQVNPATLITDTNFDSANPGTAWDGTELTIPIGKVLLTHLNTNFANNDTMQLENNASFGTIDFGDSNVLTGSLTNLAEASLMLSEDKKTVTLEFKADTTLINLTSSNIVTYYPSNDVMDANNEMYLDAGFLPMANPSDE